MKKLTPLQESGLRKIIRHLTEAHNNTFKTLDEFTRYIKRSGAAPDEMVVAGVKYTMSYYDKAGRVVEYSDDDTDRRRIEIKTSNRYGKSAFKDAEVEEYHV